MDPTKKRARAEEGGRKSSWIKSSFGPQEHESKRPRHSLTPSHQISSKPTRPANDAQKSGDLMLRRYSDLPKPNFPLPSTPLKHTARPQLAPSSHSLEASEAISKSLPSVKHLLQRPLLQSKAPALSIERNKTPLRPISIPSFGPFTDPRRSTHGAPSTPAKGPEQSPLLSRLSPFVPPPRKPITLDQTPQTIRTADNGATSLLNQIVTSEESSSNGEKGLELIKGLMMSPDKGGSRRRKGGTIKNGLAERANQVITRSQTDFSLWSHEIARSYTSSQAKISNMKCQKPSRPDLRVKIIELLTDMQHETSSGIQLRGHWKMHPPPPHILARCQVTSKKRAEKSSEDSRIFLGDASVDPHISLSLGQQPKPQPEELLVLFCMSTVSGAATVIPNGRISSVIGLEAGKDVSIWKPWTEVDAHAVVDGETSTAHGHDRAKRPVLIGSRFVVSR